MMLNDVKTIAATARRFALACPLLFALPVAVELAQHAAEVTTGFYAGKAAMKAAEQAPSRMLLGHLKVLVLLCANFWVVRFAMLGGGAARTAPPATLRRYLPVMLWGLFWLVLVQDGPMLAEPLGGQQRSVAVALLLLALAAMLFEPLLASWKVSAAAGDRTIGFGASIRLVARHYGWALGLTLLVTLPLMAVHYALAFAALGRGPAATWLLLAIDALLVGVMAAAMPLINWRVAMRAEARADSRRGVRATAG